MHWQRILVMAAALCIAPTVLFPWLHSVKPDGNIVGYQSQWIVASCAFALITAFAAVLGKRELRLTVIGWLSAFGTGVFVLAVSVVLYVLFLGANVLSGGRAWPGFGLFLSLFSSTFLLGTSLISPIVLLVIRKPTISPTNQPASMPLAAAATPVSETETPVLETPGVETTVVQKPVIESPAVSESPAENDSPDPNEKPEV